MWIKCVIIPLLKMVRYTHSSAIDLVERFCDILKIATITALCQDSYGRCRFDGMADLVAQKLQ